ncbi:MAG: hypothetical protein GF344_01280 [Chitinivibrionales bacterium]|nr:hypothetical protein [Chitinivibrionales bacterium]
MVDTDDYTPYLRALVSSARGEVPFYRRLYASYPNSIESPEDFAALPCFNDNMLSREHLHDMVRDSDKIFHVCYPPNAFVADCEMPRVQSLNDLEDEYVVLQWILEECTLDRDPVPRMAMITGEKSSYYAGEIAKMIILTLNCPFGALVYRGQEPEKLRAALESFEPEILLSTIDIAPDAVPRSVNTILYTGYDKVTPEGKYKNPDWYHLLYHPFMGLVGFGHQTGEYRYNSDYFYLENDITGQIVYTSFMQNLMPVIRYRSRDFGEVVDPHTGVLRLRYRGSH